MGFFPNCPKCAADEVMERLGGCLECMGCHHRFTEEGQKIEALEAKLEAAVTVLKAVKGFLPTYETGLWAALTDLLRQIDSATEAEREEA